LLLRLATQHHFTSVTLQVRITGIFLCRALLAVGNCLVRSRLSSELSFRGSSAVIRADVLSAVSSPSVLWDSVSGQL
jgi:hypothetical protein